ncbi:hypothetical protein [Paraglaciecola marina]|uniref:hypothetical protein n=1 Tax=Paraglaciecola marina TaxID=2500157 RepID=UPI001061BD84|nr:hypothetical protein [Paraglaciecola marina]
MFIQHGLYSLTRYERVLFLEMKGGWNQETTRAFQQDIYQKSAVLHGKPWTVITEMTDWELFTPECEPIIVETVKQSVANGLTREALINSKGSIKLHLFEKYKEQTLYFDKHIAFKRHFFTDMEAAVQWLKSEGVDVPNEFK